MADQPVKKIKTELLDFDPENPRFYRLNDDTSNEAIVEEMLDQENVQDLMLSIGQKGYFEGEPLLVVPYGKRYHVVEGNRRLAATKLLNGEIIPPSRRRSSIKEILDQAVVKAPAELPCLIYQDRKDTLRYLGYRHITGIKEWSPLSKAKYLDELRTAFYNQLNQSDQMRSLAKDIGSRSDYVAKLLTALSLYIKAESQKFLGLPIEAKDVEFSYITTALSYQNICEWLGLESSSDINMPKLELGNVKRLFGWMFSKDQLGETILGESRNLKDLAVIVSSEDAIRVLDETKKISTAYLYTDGPEKALEKALDEACVQVRAIWKMLPDTKPHTQTHLDQADTLFEDAKSIRSSLRAKLEED